MNLIGDRRPLVAVIWATIWLIALQFGAAPAQAHPGHAHEAAAITTPATVPTSIETMAVAAAEAQLAPEAQSDNSISDVPIESPERARQRLQQPHR